MSTKDTHLIPSDLALAVWSSMMLVNGQTPSCCFVAHARLQSHTFVVINSSHMQSATRQVRLDSLTYFQLLFRAPSIV